MIILFLSLNSILGPGWLGQMAGIPGTGSYTEINGSLPKNFDLDGSQYLL